jgi:hypothetical protein
MKLQKTTIAAVMILTSGLLLSQDRFDFKVRQYFFAGLAGDAASLQKGMKICEDILAKDPKQPEALVWHGMGLVSESREAFQKGDPQHGAAMWQRGLDEMDQAEVLAPEEKLDPSKFLRIHRATLVNVAHVQELHSWFAGGMMVRLKDPKHTELKVSRDRVRALKDHLGI